MNANLMMLLPLLLAKKGTTGLSPDMMMKIFQGMGKGASSQGVNPMVAMLMSMMSGKRAENAAERHGEENAPTSEPSEIFGKDVMNIIKVFMELNAKKTKNQSGSV